MKLILISAMTADRVIGAGDGLPWSIPEEYEHFLGLVRGHPVVMGRRSYEIFGPDLSESPLVVVSRSTQSLPGAEVRPGVDEALAHAGSLGETVFSAGGATIYAQTMSRADAMYLSIVKRAFQGDTYFPEFDESQWDVTRRDDHGEFEFRVYTRRAGGA